MKIEIHARDITGLTDAIRSAVDVAVGRRLDTHNRRISALESRIEGLKANIEHLQEQLQSHSHENEVPEPDLPPHRPIRVGDRYSCKGSHYTVTAVGKKSMLATNDMNDFEGKWDLDGKGLPAVIVRWL